MYILHKQFCNVNITFKLLVTKLVLKNSNQYFIYCNIFIEKYYMPTIFFHVWILVSILDFGRGPTYNQVLQQPTLEVVSKSRMRKLELFGIYHYCCFYGAMSCGKIFCVKTITKKRFFFTILSRATNEWAIFWRHIFLQSS